MRPNAGLDLASTPTVLTRARAHLLLVLSLGVSLALAPGRASAGWRRITSHSRIDAAGRVTSTQRAQYSNASNAIASISPSSLNACSIQMQQAYADHVGSLPLLRSTTSSDGRTTFRLGPLPLIRLGPIESVEGRPGLTRRRIEGGLLAARDRSGQGSLDIGVGAGKKKLSVELRLANFASALRGIKPHAPVREWLYKHTQLRLHSRVCRGFLRSLASPL